MSISHKQLICLSLSLSLFLCSSSLMAMEENKSSGGFYLPLFSSAIDISGLFGGEFLRENDVNELQDKNTQIKIAVADGAQIAGAAMFVPMMVGTALDMDGQSISCATVATGLFTGLYYGYKQYQKMQDGHKEINENLNMSSETKRMAIQHLHKNMGRENRLWSIAVDVGALVSYVPVRLALLGVRKATELSFM